MAPISPQFLVAFGPDKYGERAQVMSKGTTQHTDIERSVQGQTNPSVKMSKGTGTTQEMNRHMFHITMTNL